MRHVKFDLYSGDNIMILVLTESFIFGVIIQTFQALTFEFYNNLNFDKYFDALWLDHAIRQSQYNVSQSLVQRSYTVCGESKMNLFSSDQLSSGFFNCELQLYSLSQMSWKCPFTLPVRGSRKDSTKGHRSCANICSMRMREELCQI